MDLKFDINRSLKAKPPKYGLGIKYNKDNCRKPFKLANLIVEDEAGVSLQPRDKELETGNTLQDSYRKYGVLYDREVMVVEQREDGNLELQSGFNRRSDLMDMGVETYFGDHITYSNNYFKSMWKRRFNATFTDHLAKGTPNTPAAYLKGLREAVAFESFEWKKDDKVLEALDFMANGSLDVDEMNKLLEKFRKTNNPDPNLVSLDTPMAGKILETMGLPHSGYVKNVKKKAYDRIGFARWDGNSMSKLCTWIDLYDTHKKPIEIYAFIEWIDPSRYKEQRKAWKKQFDNSMKWMTDHFDSKYHNIIKFVGFIAQISTPNPKDGGKRLERGIVDIDGNIIIDTFNGK